MIYPWQNEQWQKFDDMRRSNRLPHALLLNGVAGLGKLSFATEMANALLCEKTQDKGVACQQCHSCRIVAAASHPDMRLLQPEKEGQAIKVDQVREITDFVQQSALQGRARVVIIHPANRLNLNAANALLKTLEEPPGGAYLILISHQLKGLLPTIISRCQRMDFNKPKRDIAAKWLLEQGVESTELELLLNIAQGAPLTALNLQQDELLTVREQLYRSLTDIMLEQHKLLSVAEKYKDIQSLGFIDLLLSWVTDVLRCQLGAHSLTNRDFIEPLSQVAKKTKTDSNLLLINYLMRLRGIIQSGVVLNKQLVVESILIKWCQQ